MRTRVWFPLTGLLAWLCCLRLGPVQGEKVLVFPADGSQWLSMKILVKELGRRGHEVTVLVPESSMLIQGSDSFKTEVYKVPYTQAELDKNFNMFKEGLFDQQPGLADLFVNVNRLLIFTTPQVVSCEALLDNEPLMTKLGREGFDMMLTDPFLPCGSILV
ncbi:PREDICTED: UDP-glucuronosyltransferase 1-2-like [Poecilia mexicana]|uniref:UDP-glucuronosyltransferase 1-2-like n=1 Tax=Poecilia mexicana TaxID=48701 RepID=UPI00072EAA2F|nr:PREDICTED: UDP-glucuronosyltransferase 1-2-like [Poecilia mexicana]